MLTRRISSIYRLHYAPSFSSVRFHSTEQLNVEVTKTKRDVQQGPNLQDFIKNSSSSGPVKGLSKVNVNLNNFPIFASDTPLAFYIETYGCQMNVSDSEIVNSCLKSAGHYEVKDITEADLILTNTCAVRENAESKVWNRLQYFQHLRKTHKSRYILSKELEQYKNQEIPLNIAPSAVSMNTARSLFMENIDATNMDEVSILDDQNKVPNLLGKVQRNKIILDLPQQQFPLVGILGCMAERLKTNLLEHDSVDFICGPDSYRDIPRLIQNLITTAGQKQANTILSLEETYADIAPVREVNSISAFISIMRGCNNMCSFCIVPFTRGRERSRPFLSVLKEVGDLSAKGIKEVVFLGQNVNGYHDVDKESIDYITNHPDLAHIKLNQQYKAAPGFNNMYHSKKKDTAGIRFFDLLDIVATLYPEVRIRFTSPHPKDFPEEIFTIIKKHNNISKSLHMPLQSGSSTCLDRMRRGYTKEAYLELIQTAKRILPNVAISTDVIAGFCGETEEEHKQTVEVMKSVVFDQAFMFAYSLRDKTHAARNLEDNVDEKVKNTRLNEIIATFRENVLLKNKQEFDGRFELVLIEGLATSNSKKRDTIMLTGRSDGNRRILFPFTSTTVVDYETVLKSNSHPLFKKDIDISQEDRDNLLKYGLPADNNIKEEMKEDELIGKFAVVRILDSNSTTLRGVMLGTSTISDFYKHETKLNFA